MTRYLWVLAIAFGCACMASANKPVAVQKKQKASEKTYADLAKARADMAAKRQELEDKRAQADALRKQIIQSKKATKQLKQAQAAARPGAIDYSKFDRCPEGNPWSQCNHEEEKQAWLAEQTASRAEKFAAESKKILDDLARRQDDVQKSLGDYTKRATAYESERAKQERDVNEFETKVKALTREAFDDTLKTSLGWLSKGEEVGAKGGADTVSSGMKANGQADPGGVSYGLYQMTSQTTNRATKQVTVGGTVEDFTRKYYAQEFAGIVPGTQAYSDKWKQIADSDYKTFGERQHAYIKETHYDPLARTLKQSANFDAGTANKVVQNALWSAAVQHGPGNSANIFKPVLENTTGKTPQQVLKDLYDARTKFYPEGKSRYDSELEKATKALEQPDADQ